MKKITAIILTILLIISFCGCSGTSSVTKQSFHFDTVISISTDKKDIKKSEDAFRLCSDLENIFSRTKEGSELWLLNNKKLSSLSSDLKNVIDFSLYVSSLTDGAFDITIAPLSDLWNVKERTIPPKEEEIKKHLSRVDYKKISTNPLDIKDAAIDLGAVAKGYAADLITTHFRDEGVKNAIIDLGGNVCLIGEYTVGIRDPFNPEALYAKITLKDKSAVTSGAYQRYFEHEGVRYHHIIDPRTGNCADSALASVTVISPSSMQADALSTAIYVLGEDGIRICNNFPDTDALLITENGDIITTDGFKEKYQLELFEK